MHSEEAKWQIVSESGTGMEASCVERPHVTSSCLVAKINHGPLRTKGKQGEKDRDRSCSCDCAVHSRKNEKYLVKGVKDQHSETHVP